MKSLFPQVLAGKPGTLGTWSIEKQVPAHRQTHGHRKETRRKRLRNAKRNRYCIVEELKGPFLRSF
jgi:hypothetical protein